VVGILLYEKKDKIGCITLNRPERLNAMSRQLSSELTQTLQGLDEDPEVWVGIVTGAGDRAFCVGADLRDPGHRVAPEEWEAGYVSQLTSVKKPMIAAVNGYCLGAGFTLALACDIRVASEMASFGTPDQKLNTVDCYGSLALAHFVAPAIAMEILFTGDRITAQEAYRVGLVSRVVPQAELMSTAELIARKICENGPLAIRACKELAKRGRTLNLDDGLSLFKALVRPVLSSEDTQEGVAAFLEKRAAIWKCR
jgi:enoyl-CoA hydratase/carnithine racemase